MLQRPAGWNSSIGLPEGSSSRICWPPGPVTMSLRNLSPPARSRPTSAAMSSTTNSIRFQPPGVGFSPSGMGVPAGREAEVQNVEVGGGSHVIDHVADVDGLFGHVSHLLAGRFPSSDDRGR